IDLLNFDPIAATLDGEAPPLAYVVNTVWSDSSLEATSFLEGLTGATHQASFAAVQDALAQYLKATTGLIDVSDPAVMGTIVQMAATRLGEQVNPPAVMAVGAAMAEANRAALAAAG